MELVSQGILDGHGILGSQVAEASARQVERQVDHWCVKWRGGGRLNRPGCLGRSGRLGRCLSRSHTGRCSRCLRTACTNKGLQLVESSQ